MDPKIINLAEELEDEENSEILQKVPFYKKKSFIIIIIISIIAILIAIGIILFFILRKNLNNNNKRKENEKNEEINDEIDKIICIYNIKNNSKNISIISNEFRNEFNIGIIVDGENKNFTRVYKFSTIGEHKIEFLL